MNQVWDANKKQLHGMRQLGALQAKEKKKKKPNPSSKRQRCSCEEFKNLHVVSITEIYLFVWG